jgi:DNA invertase Pin-like site-specific DNA recombinase
MTSSAPRFVVYVRVSTQKQGASGLGLEAQQSAIADHVARCGGSVAGSFVEVESGRKTDKQRPQLAAAMALAKAQKATLLIAKLDRLARNLHFVAGLLESGVSFICLDVPEGGKQMIQMKAMVAEWERDMISQRTKDALKAAQARGVKLGVMGGQNIKALNDAREEGVKARAEAMRDDLTAVARGTLRAASTALALKGHVTSKGKPFSAAQVARLLKVLNLVEAQAA